MRRRVRVHYSLILATLCCARTIKIPPESVALSRTVTTNIKDLQQKHANLVDAYGRAVPLKCRASLIAMYIFQRSYRAAPMPLSIG